MINMERTATEITSSYSEKAINELRGTLTEILPDSKVLVVTVGSFARREASDQSDLDFFVIYEKNEESAKEDYKKIRRVFEESGVWMPATDGSFAELENSDEMVKNVGGNNDTTERLTRRMLFLLECEWLYNEKYFQELFDEIIKIYVKDTITQHQLCRFLLNDLIRYYRTICVDFEYKTTEKGKSWGDRNIKLMFSRKLLFFSGLLTIAETVQHTCDTKREILRTNLRLTPIDRTKKICGTKADKVLSLYDEFLDKLSTKSVRDMLNKTEDNRDNHSEAFRNLKNKGHHFSSELSRLLSETYDTAHPIHHALKF